MSETRFYKIWLGIIKRCKNKNASRYSYYGKRGVVVEWKTFMEFNQDMYKSYLDHIREFGEKNTTIKRVNNDGNYSKKNCKWATRKEQAINRRTTHFITWEGKTRSVKDWAEILGIRRATLSQRLNRHEWSIKKAFTTPTRVFCWKKGKNYE